MDTFRGLQMINFIQRFFNSEDGAVTVDWVVLTALVVGLAVASFTSAKSANIMCVSP